MQSIDRHMKGTACALPLHGGPRCYTDVFTEPSGIPATPLLVALESAASSVWLAGTAGPTERSIVSVLWSSVVGASSQGPAPRHHQLSLGVVLASQGEGEEGVSEHRYPTVP